MSLTTIASRPLARELLARELDGALAVLGGEADERLARAPARGERRRARPAVGSSSSVRRSRPAFLILPARGCAGREVGDRRRHQQDVAARELLLARALQLGCA